MTSSLRSIFLFILLTGTFARGAARIDVILWFDTEDYISPSDDDADKRLAELLTAKGVRATFKVVGEKARVLERHRRQDVIDALKKHDIGYHANFHSVHPTVAEYEADCGLLDGIDEFVRREGPGAADVRRIFARASLACYGQPGSSWAAQAIAAMPRCGIETDGVPCYLDSGQHVGIGGSPFWYAGALNVYKMQPNETRMDLFADGGLEKGRKSFTEIADRLRQNGGGLISIYYHPCEWVTSEFWDGPNFSRGANPPREQWKLPKQRPPAEAEAAFERFSSYIDSIKAAPDVRFVTASDLPTIYRDPVQAEGVGDDELAQLAAAIHRDATGIDDVTIGGKTFSPADQFQLLADALARRIDPKPASAVERPRARRVLGPDGPPPAKNRGARDPIAWPAFASAVTDASDFVRREGRIPSRVFIGPEPVAPADFLVGMASAYADLRSTGRPPAAVTIGNDVRVLTERFVAEDSEKLFAGWIIHPAGFRAPRIMDVARLQSWTLKPAQRAE